MELKVDALARTAGKATGPKDRRRLRRTQLPGRPNGPQTFFFDPTLLNIDLAAWKRWEYSKNDRSSGVLHN